MQCRVPRDSHFNSINHTSPPGLPTALCVCLIQSLPLLPIPPAQPEEHALSNGVLGTAQEISLQMVPLSQGLESRPNPPATEDKQNSFSYTLTLIHSSSTRSQISEAWRFKLELFLYKEKRSLSSTLLAK